MSKRAAAGKPATGALTKGFVVASRSTGSMLRTISQDRDSNVAKRSPVGIIGSTSGAGGTVVARRSPSGARGTICRSRGATIASRAAGAGLRKLSRTKGTEVAGRTVSGSVRTYRAKSAVTRGVVVIRAPEREMVEKVPAELARYRVPIYRGGRKRSISMVRAGTRSPLSLQGPNSIPSLSRPGVCCTKKYLDQQKKEWERQEKTSPARGEVYEEQLSAPLLDILKEKRKLELTAEELKALRREAEAARKGKLEARGVRLRGLREQKRGKQK